MTYELPEIIEIGDAEELIQGKIWPANQDNPLIVNSGRAV